MLQGGGLDAVSTPSLDVTFGMILATRVRDVDERARLPYVAIGKA